MGFSRVASTMIEAALEASGRFDHEDGVAIGLTHYRTASSEPACRQAGATAHYYVLRGMLEYRDLLTNEIHRFVAGDFFSIDPGTEYIRRIKQDTRILFSTSPLGDIEPISPVSGEALQWAREPLRVKRLDLRAGPDSARPNSLKPAVAAAVTDSARRLLLVRRRDSGFWAMPGGTMELDDSVESCARREVLEETGVRISVSGIIGVYSDPDALIAYSDGEIRREFSILLAASSETTALHHDDESTDAQWVALDDLSSYPMVTSQQTRIADVIAYLNGEGLTVPKGK